MKRSLFHPTVHTVRRLFSALDRVCRFQPLCLLMAARQTSIITTTAPPAPALAANVETEPAVFTSDVVLPTRVEQIGCARVIDHDLSLSLTCPPSVIHNAAH